MEINSINNPKNIIKFGNVCSNPNSTNVSTLEERGKKNILDTLIKIENNQSINDLINNFIENLGEIERHSHMYILSNDRYILDNNAYKQAIELALLHMGEISKTVSQIRSGNIMTYLNNNFILNNNMFELTRKAKIGTNPVKKTIYYLFDSKLFGVGHLSPSILIDLQFMNHDEKGEQIITKTLAKVYPLRLSKSNVYANFKKNIDDMMEFIFYREALLNSWIQLHLINKKITETFVCIYDIIITNKLPLYDEYIQKLQYFLTNGTYKNWFMYNAVNSPLFKDKDSYFGMIEMEKVDFTLSEVINNQCVTIDHLFEVLYSKLCLAFIGNIYPDDDHSNNIMIKYTSRKRHYEIIRRDTSYHFYIRDNLMIKYIDMERYTIITNRNVYIRNYLNDSWYNTMYFKKHSPIFKKTTKENCIQLLENLQYNNKVDNFCEFMHRYVPDEYLKKQNNETDNDFDHFKLNLDIEDPKNFLSDANITQQLDKPYRLMKKDLFGGNQIKRYKLKI